MKHLSYRDEIFAIRRSNYLYKYHHTKEMTKGPFQVILYRSRIYGHFYTSAMRFSESGDQTTPKSSLKITNSAEGLFRYLWVSIGYVSYFQIWSVLVRANSKFCVEYARQNRFELSSLVLMLQLAGLWSLFRSLFASIG